MIGHSRRDALAVGGVTVLFALAGLPFQPDGVAAEPDKPAHPGSLSVDPRLSSWIRLAPDGKVTVFSGKVELGQGLRTALVQIAADELDVDPTEITLVTGDTGRTPNEGFTAGSHSLQDSGTAIAVAAANVRHILALEAARQLAVPVDSLHSGSGRFQTKDGRRLDYGALAAALSRTVEVDPAIRRKAVAHHVLIGRDFSRIDIPAKLTGGESFIQDLRMPGMLHGRVVRGPADGAALTDADWQKILQMPGILQAVRNGRFAAIVGEREWPLVQALQAIGEGDWSAARVPPADRDRFETLTKMASIDSVILERGTVMPTGARGLTARYSRPYLMHGSIGPSCAIALHENGQLTVWTHSQGVYPLQRALAGLVGLPLANVRCIHAEGAGCYGHNGADDVAADAALAAMAVPGRPVRIQWTREQEHGWEPLGTAMVTELSAALDGRGRIMGWRHDIWSPSHAARPIRPGDLLAAQEVTPPLPPSKPFAIPQPEGGGDRNGIPIYALPNAKVVHHFIPDTPVKVSALRSLGAHLNVFAIESFMDELALAAARDPVAFRLAHLDDERAIGVVRLAAEKFGWSRYRRKKNRGAGFGFARYKNLGGYCAIAMDVELVPGPAPLKIHRVTAAVDCGEAVNPDGIRNQIEGAVVQSISWTGLEEVDFSEERRRPLDWIGYPILRFTALPASIDVHVIDRPGTPFLGAGEAAQGPAAAALANAIAAATGNRRRDMPLHKSLARGG